MTRVDFPINKQKLNKLDIWILSKVNKLLTLLNEEKILLAKKESILENKNNIIAQIRGPNKDLDLIDQLIRLELGFSDKNEIVILDSPQ